MLKKLFVDIIGPRRDQVDFNPGELNTIEPESYETKRAKAKESMGSKWLFHPDHRVTKAKE